MAWSRRRSWFVVALMVVAVAVAIGAVVFLPRPDPLVDTARVQWRAQSDTLVRRVEQLSAAGEVDAAASVLEVLAQRPDLAASGQDDRARMALARAYLTSGRRDQALKHVQAIPWADKGPQVAAEIVGLELAVRWRGLFDEQGDLVSGAITPRNSFEASSGRPDGLWRERWDEYRALATALDRGARMVAAEHGHVVMPAGAALLRLARFSRGDGTQAALMSALGDPQHWDADLALAVERLLLSEHDPIAALMAAEVLWSRHATSTQAGLALRDLRLWQGRRRALAETMALWAFPEVDARIDAVARHYAAMAASADTALQQEREINRTAMNAAVTRIVSDKKVELGEGSDLLLVDGGEESREWRLARSYDGLRVQADHQEVAAGRVAGFQVTSEHRGEHRLRIHRLADRTAWEVFCAKPARALLPDAVAQEITFQPGDWSTIGTPITHPLSIPDLSEGFYAVTLSARACPVVVVSGVAVIDADLHLIAGRTEVLGWIVRRASGQAKPGVSLVASVTLERNVVQAAGDAWRAADPAWRSGFTEGFTGKPSPDFRRPDQQALFTTGVTAGRAAATRDPAFTIDLTGTSDATGLVRIALPERLHGRSYRVAAHTIGSAVAVTRQASYGADAAWTSTAVAWADKPLARPGETVRFKALLRDFNGDGYRLPVGELTARVHLGSSTLAELPLAISDLGTISGEVLIPPGAIEDQLSLTLGEGARLHLGRVERVRLPAVRYEIIGLESHLQVRAGESVPFLLRLRDRAGEPLAGVTVACALWARAQGSEIPCEKVADVITDLAGEARFSIPTAAKSEADYNATLVFTYGDATYEASHAWRTHTFPFQLDSVVRKRDLRVGGVAQVELRLPVGAEVAIQLSRSGALCGKPLTAQGRWPSWTQLAVPLTDEHLGCDALQISAKVLGSGTAIRVLNLAVQERETSDGSAQVVAVPVNNRVETGEVLPLALGVSDPGRDVLVIAGAREVVLAQVERLEQSSRTVELPVASAWAPNLFLNAVAYLPERGFVTSEPREVAVLPVDRLLKVAVMPTRTDLRPGDQVEALVEVRDWRGQPVAGCSLSLGVVDEVLFQLAEDPTPDLWTYFHTYHRSRGLTDGVAERLPFPRAILWRSIIHRWQGEGAFTAIGARHGGGRSMASMRSGGARGSGRVVLRPEADGTIHWVADLRTDAQGRAQVRFALPPNAGRFRCTARANDASAAVLVGEVRSHLVSREAYSCTIDLPDVVAAGDVIPAQIQLANHEDREQTLLVTLPDGTTREVTLASRMRRTLTVPVTIPGRGTPGRGAVPGGILRVGDLLGEPVDLAVAVQAKEGVARVVRAAASTVRRLPGYPQSSRQRLVAGADGLVRLPQAIAPGAGVWLRLRAWPDAAARRAGELAGWRQRTDSPVLQAMGWLLAEAGAERREHLAALWPKLTDDPHAVVVKQMANRLGEAVDGIKQVPDDAIGDWLLARGRALGQTLPAPKRRAAGGNALSARVALAATALAEGWGEGRSRWAAVRDELLTMTGDDALALGIACEAAVFAGDAEVGQRFAARLAQCRWSGDLAAVLAVGLLPERSERAVGPVVIHSDGQPFVVPANEFADWSGVVGDLELRADPGALVDLDLIVQQPLPRCEPGGVTTTLWQEADDGFERVIEGQPLWPGRRVLLVVDCVDSPRDITIALPSLLRRERQGGEVFLVDGYEDHWDLEQDDRSRLLQLLQDGRRTAMVSDLAGVLERQVAQRAPLGQRLAITAPEDGRIVHGGQLITHAAARGRTVFALSVIGEGSCAWAGLRVADFQQQERRLVVRADNDVHTPARTVGHPLRAAVLAALSRGHDGEAAWLVGERRPSTLEQWRTALRILDSTVDQSLDELLDHPARLTTGHWTQAKIRRWIDGEPLLHADAAEVREVIGSDEPTLSSLITLAQTSRAQHRQAWGALPQPQKVPATSPVTLRRWYDRLVQLGLIRGGTYRAWCWQQDLSRRDLAVLGYDDTIDDWVAFLRQQLDLPVRIGTGVRTAMGYQQWVSHPGPDHTGQLLQSEPIRRANLEGTCLGLAGLAEALIMVELLDGYELRPLQPSPSPRPAAISVDYADIPLGEVIDHLNVLLANRALPQIRLGSTLTRDALQQMTPLTLRVQDMPVEPMLDFIGQITGLKYRRDRSGHVFERE